MKRKSIIRFTTLAMLAYAMPNFASAVADGQDEGFAMFDNFVYSGNDDFYNSNPLPGPSSFYNPILPGWNSDPSICRAGNDYFMVTSTFSYFPGVPLFHSKDLLNWKQVGYVLDRPSQLPLDGQKTSEGIFAPAISYNPNNKTFYMITTNIRLGNFFVKTKDPFGEWSDPIRLPDVGGIDPSFFFDDNGKAYIVNNDAPEGPAEYDGHRAIKVREFDVATDKTVGPTKVLVNKGVHPEDKPIWIEGPHMYKINGKYYLMDAEGGTSDMHSEVIFRSDSPFGPFVPAKQNPILTQRHLPADRPNPVTCAGHADLVQTPEGDWYAVFLACRPYDGKSENLGRETFLMPVRWNADGFPYITEGNETVPLVSEVKGATRGNEVTFGNFTYKDDFSSAELDLGWFSLRAPASTFCSLSKNKGYLTMPCIDVKASEMKTPALVTRRISHHKFECSTRLTFSPAQAGDKAGLMLYKDENHQYLLCVVKTNDDRQVEVLKVSDGGAEEVMAFSPINNDNNDISLKVTSDGPTFSFHYSKNGNDWETLKTGVDAYYLTTRNAGGFTGTTIGLYTSSK